MRALLSPPPQGLGSYPTPVDVFTWTGGTIVDNSFTLSGGNFVSGGFSIQTTTIGGANGDNDQLFVNAPCCGGRRATNFLDIGSNDSLFVWNQNNNGPGDITFTAVTAAVPEPGTLVLLAMGLIGFGAVRRRRA